MTKNYRSRTFRRGTTVKRGTLGRRAHSIPLSSTTSATTVSNYSVKSSKIFRGFYSTMRQFFPTLNEQSFSRVFAQFITTPDFSEFLKIVPEFSDLHISKTKMNDIMVKMANQIASNVTRRRNGRRSTPRIIAGGEMGDNLLLSGYAMLQICLATYTYLRLPRRYAFFFVALVLYYFFVQFEVMFGMRNADYQDLILPNIAVSTIEAGTVTTHGITSIFGWLKRLLRSRERSSEMNSRVDRLQPSHAHTPGPRALQLLPQPQHPDQVHQSRAVSSTVSPRRRSLYLTPSDELANLANIPQTSASLPYRRRPGAYSP